MSMNNLIIEQQYNVKLNGRDIFLTTNNIAQKNIEDIVAELCSGLERSPIRKEVSGMHFFRRKIKIQNYKLIDGVLHIEASGPHCSKVICIHVGCPDIVFNRVKWL